MNNQQKIQYSIYHQDRTVEVIIDNQTPAIKQYLSFFQLSTIDQLQTIRSTAIKMLDNQIIVSPNIDFEHDFDMQINSHTKNQEFIDVKVRIGCFIFPEIHIAHFKRASPTHKIQTCFKGNFCSVYRAACSDQCVAIKCHSFQKSNKLQKLSNVINEFCLFKIASLLKVGPRMLKYFGFDIMIFEQCYEFPMQFCPKFGNLNDINKCEKQLKDSLLLLHSLNIIHFDIKPNNICYSPSYQKYVFIDFGLSKVTKGQLGSLKKTRFKGSLEYCSAQMKNVYLNNCQSWVDLYYNDMHCLKVSFPIMPKNINFMNQANDSIFQERQYDITRDILLMYLKFLLYKMNINQFERVCAEYYEFIILRFGVELINFIRELSYFYYLSQIYKKLLNHKEMEVNSRGMKLIKYEPYQKNQDALLMNKDQVSVDQKDNSILNIISKLPALYANQQQFTCQQTNVNALQNYQLILQMPKNIYFSKLAKAIQINCDSCSLQNKIKYCKTARIVYNQQLFDQVKITVKQQVCLSQMSLIIFKFCLQPPVSQIKFGIFMNIIYNIIILEVVSTQQMAKYIEQVIEVEIDFQSKLRMLLKLASLITWISFRVNSNLDQSQLKNTFNYKCRSYLHSQIINHQCDELQQQIWIWFLALFKFQDKYDFSPITEAFSYLWKYSKKLGKQLSLELDTWVSYLKMSINQEMSQLLNHKFQTYMYSQSFLTRQTFEYYDFLLLLINFRKKCDIKIKSTVKKYNSIFKFTSIYQKYFVYLISLLQVLKQKKDFWSLRNLLHVVFLQQREYSQNFLINILLSNQLFFMLQHPLFVELPETERQRLFTSPILINYVVNHEHQINIFQQIFRNITTMDREYALKNKIVGKNSLLQKFTAFYWMELQAVNMKSCQKCYKYGMFTLNLMLAYILFRKNQKQRSIELCFNLLNLLHNYSNFYEAPILQFHQKLLSLLVNICRSDPSLQQIHKSYILYYNHQKQTNNFNVYFQKPNIIDRTFESLFDNNPEELSFFINKLTNYLYFNVSKINNRNFITNMNKAFQQIKHKPHALPKLKVVINNLQNIHQNPYIGLFLNLLSSVFQSISTNRMRINICKSLNYVSCDVKWQIQSQLYLCALKNNSIFNKRHHISLYRKSLKYRNFNITTSQLLKSYFVSIHGKNMQKQFVIKAMKRVLKRYQYNIIKTF